MIQYRISIHALLAESDPIFGKIDTRRRVFLSTLSLRRATDGLFFFGGRNRISIHALLAESDIPSIGTFRSTHNFYPRSPCGERPPYNLMIQQKKEISIHALLAESDPSISTPKPGKVISIHALLAESDCRAETSESRYRHFYPRSPCGERLESRSNILKTSQYFYPRSPCGERPI